MFVACCLLFLISLLFLTYFVVILGRRVDPEAKQNIILGILVSAFILVLDLIASKFINIFVIFEKHFSSAGRNWKRISYLSAFIIFNSLAAVLAYCTSEPMALLGTDVANVKYQPTNYSYSYNEWLKACATTPQHHVENMQQRIGYWRLYTSQFIDGIHVPAFGYDINKRLNDIDPNIQVGCDGKKKFLCEHNNKTTIQYSDSCAFISNMLDFSPVPEIVFSGKVYDLPWKIASGDLGSKFRLNSFANEGSLYGFLFAFILVKAARMVLYYLYNYLVSFVSHRMLLPLLRWQGYDTTVSSKRLICFIAFAM